MKVTKEQLIEAFNTIVEKQDLSFNSENHTLKLVLENPKMSSNEFENVVGWLTEIFYSGYNQILINSNSSLTGVIYLNDATSHSKKIILHNAQLYRTAISDSTDCTIIESKIQDGSITSIGFIGSGVVIKYSNLNGCDIEDCCVDHSSVVSKGLQKKVVLVDCRVTHSKLHSGPCTINKKSFSSVIIDADKFSGDYFSVGLNGETVTGYINGAEKIIVMGEKKYNPGSWEEQYVKKEHNQFIKMMNQKKLEMMNMFFDSLAFK